MKQTFLARNLNGQPTIAQSHALKEFMRSFGDDLYQLTVEKRSKKRSNQQSAYYWGCLVPAVMDGLIDNGYPKSELNTEVIHLMLREKFLRTDIVSEHSGEIISRIRSTTELSTIDFNTFIDDIIRWSAEVLNIYISLPNEQSMLAL